MAGIVITTQPTSAVVNKNRAATLSVSATATAGTLNYDWYEDATVDVLLQSGTSNTFTPLPLTLSKSYYVKVWTSDAPTVFFTSSIVTITVIDPPVISTEPVGSAINSGESVTLSVAIESSPNSSPVTYQWYLGISGIVDNPVVGATSPSYTITNVTDSQTFWVRVQNDAGYDDSISARISVIEPLYDDSVAIRQEKAAVFGGSFGYSSETDSILSDFPLDSIKVLSQAQSLSDCAKNLPNRLMDMAIQFATKKAESLLKDTTGITFQDLQNLKDKYDASQRVMEQIQNLNPKKPTLIDAIAALKAATGVDLIEKTNKVLNDFAAVSGISDIVNKALSSDFCKISNYGLDGKPVPATSNIPMGIPPSTVEGVPNPVGVSEYSSQAKDEYDAFIFQLKEQIDADETKLASLSGSEKESYTSSASLLHTIALAYHDKLSKTVDNSKDAQYRSEFEVAIQDTLNKNSSWNASTISEFTNKGRIVSDIINRNAQIIRNFYNPGGTGEWLPWYMSAYGHVKADDGSSFDKTTEADIKSGSIKEDWQYLGTRNNKLVKGTSVASNYWKFGTVLEIRYADTKQPVGSGKVRVDDSGGMSKNVLDYFCAGDKELFKSITAGSKNQGGATKPSYTTPIEIRVISGGPKESKMA